MKRLLGLSLIVLAACGNSQPAQMPPPSASAEPTGGAPASTPSAGAEPAAPTNSDDVRKGISAMKAGDYNAARASFESAITKNPNQADAYFYLAQMMERTGDKVTAEKDYKKALELQPDLLDAAVNLVALEIEAKKYDDAIAVAKSAIAKNPKDAMMHFNYGAALAGKNDQD
ncbi:MAG TPA: tetratricopeptide repeat protein, partial [Labilithrix sp.]